MVKGKQFQNFRDVGDPVSAARIYNAQNADELVFIDIEASNEGRQTMIAVIEAVSRECFMPLTVGGGVRTIDDIRTLVRSGADKVVVTTAAVEDSEFVREAVETFGAQCIIMGIDVRRDPELGYRVFSQCGRVRHDLDLSAQLTRASDLGVGEVLVTSIDEDGMMAGYDLDLVRAARAAIDVPLIVSGGAGNFQHLAEALEAGADAAACASIFHFGDNNPIRARSFLKNRGFPVKHV
jgi:imidazole glycerol-phosphate synthase subunit HisF